MSPRGLADRSGDPEAMHRATEADIRELSEAHTRVTDVRRELEAAEGKVADIRERLHVAETQLANAIRAVVARDTT